MTNLDVQVLNFMINSGYIIATIALGVLLWSVFKK